MNRPRASAMTITSAIVIGTVFFVFAAAKIKEHSAIDPNKCTNCAECVSVCPEEAISVAKVNGKAVHVINIHKCSNCGACIAVCEDKAISPDKTDLSALEQQAKSSKKKGGKKKGSK